MLDFSRWLQRNSGYQSPQKVTILKNYHSLPLLAFMGISGVRLTYPCGI